MNKKTLSAFLCVGLALGVLGVVAVSVPHEQALYKTEADKVYTLTMDSSHNTLGEGDFSTVYINSVYPIKIEHEGLTTTAGKLTTMAFDGFIRNADPIHQLESIIVSYESTQPMHITYGFSVASDTTEQQLWNYDILDTLTTGVAYDFNGKQPAHFAIYSDAVTVIDSIVITYSCGAGYTLDIGDNYSIAYSNEEYATSIPNVWRAWYDQGWCGTTVEINDSGVIDGEPFFYYEVTGTHCDWGIQLFYYNNTLTIGKTYDLTMTININVAKSLTINGKNFNLVAGDNDIAIRYTQVAGVSIKIIIATAGGDSVGLMISDILWTEHVYSVPRNILLNDNNELTFSPIADATGYEAVVVSEDNLEPNDANVFSVTSSDDISSHIPASDGIYFVRVRGVKGAVKCDWSDPVMARVVGTKTAVTNLEESKLTRNSTWYQWNDKTWCGSNTAIGECSVVGDKFVYSFNCFDGACEYGVQAFIKFDTNLPSNQYKVEFTLFSATEISIKIRTGNSGEPVWDLVAGENEISQTYTETDSASIALVIPVEAGLSNTLIISNLTITPLIS